MLATSNVSRLVLFITVPVAVTLSVASDQAQRVIVVSIAGDWRYGKDRITFGQSLPAQGCLVGSDGSVVLQPEKNDSPPLPFACEKPFHDSECPGHDQDRCAIPLDPRKWKASGGGFGNLWGAVKQLLLGDPEKYMVAASRGIEDALIDAVVPLQGENLDLGPAFREMSAGQYWIEFESVTGPAASHKPLELRFAPHNPAIVPASAVRPGLYRLLLVDKTGVPVGSDCWILVSPLEKYSAVTRQFQRTVDDSAKWPQEMDPSAAHALLRAYLESLSTSGATSTP